MISPTGRWLAVLSIALPSFTAAAACSGPASHNMNAETDCPQQAGNAAAPCTVTFERDEEATASVFDTRIELVSAATDSVDLKVAGIPFTVTKGETESQEANLNITIKSITEDKVVLKIGDVSAV